MYEFLSISSHMIQDENTLRNIYLFLQNIIYNIET